MEDINAILKKAQSGDNEAIDLILKEYSKLLSFNAQKYYLIGAKRSEKVATSAIGYCYEMEGNYEEAKKWYKKAVDLGEKEFASERLQDIGNK